MIESEAGLAFSKYHGLGNDYLVIDDQAGDLGLAAPAVQRICNRTFGIGSDGILLRGRDAGPGVFAVRIFNPDGSEAEKSGNGLRIFARYLFDRGDVGGESFSVRTAGGIVACEVLERGAAVRVEMGRLSFDSRKIPVAGPPRDVLLETFEIAGRSLEYSAVTIGNPHCVVFLDAIDGDEILELGPLIECEPRFPNRTNVQLAKVVDRGTLRIEIWERGAGHTLASGSSSCAAAGVAHRLGYCDGSIDVEMRGGTLAVEIDSKYAVVQRGPVVHVAEGVCLFEALRD